MSAEDASATQIDPSVIQDATPFPQAVDPTAAEAGWEQAQKTLINTINVINAPPVPPAQEPVIAPAPAVEAEQPAPLTGVQLPEVLLNYIRDLESPHFRTRESATRILSGVIADSSGRALATLLEALGTESRRTSRSLEFKRRLLEIVSRSLPSAYRSLTSITNNINNSNGRADAQEITSRILLSLARLDLISDEDRATWLVRYLGRNNRTAPLTELARNGSTLIRREIAGSFFTPATILTEISSRDADATVRAEVAANWYTPRATLTALFEETSAGLRRDGYDLSLQRILRELAGNWRAPPEILTALSENADELVRSGVANNWYAPPGVLRRMLLHRTESVSVRYGAARNPRTPRSALRALLESSEIGGGAAEAIAIRTAAQANLDSRPADEEREQGEPQEPDQGVAPEDEQFPVSDGEEQPATGIPEEIEIPRLVRDLNSSDYRVRERASLTLRAALAGCRDDSAVSALLTGIGNEIPQNPSAELIGRIADLMSSIDLSIRRRLVIDPGTSREALTLLVRDHYLLIRTLATLHPNMDSAAAARDQALITLRDIAENPITAPADLGFLARVPNQDVNVLRLVAENPNTPSEDLGFLARVPNQDFDVLWAVAGNPNTLPAALNFLARMPNQAVEILRAIAENENAPPAALRFLARMPDQDRNVLRLVAGNWYTAPEDLGFLARVRFQYVDVLRAVAWNRHTPSEDLDFLARMPDQDFEVLCNIAWRSTSPETLDFLARMENQYVDVLYYIAWNLYASPATLDFLARMPDQDVDVLYRVAKNPYTSPATLTFLARMPDQDVDVLIGVAENSNTLSADLDFLAWMQNQATDVLRAVAANPRTPEVTLLVLTQNANQSVSRAAQITLALLHFPMIGLF